MCIGSLCIKGHGHAGDMVTHLHVTNIQAEGSLPEEVTFQEGLKDEQHLARQREHLSGHNLFTCQLKAVCVA